MRLVADHCPSCGARVQVDEDAAEASCTYCAASFRVGARRGAHPPEDAPGYTPSRGRPIAVVVVAAIAAIGLTIALLTLRSGDTAPSAPGEAVAAAAVAPPGPEEAHPSWLAHRQAILVDVNGDGLKDPVGWARYYQKPGTPQHFVAIDAASGKRLWQSDAFSPDGWSAIRVALLGDRLLVADNGGLLRAIEARTGRTQWSTPLGERVRRICRRTEGGALLYLEDDRALEVQLATGSLTPRGAADRRDARCEVLVSGEPGQDPDVHVESPSLRFGGRAEIDGMDTRELVVARGSPLAFALGVRQPGTAVPMVAAFPVPATWPERSADGAYTPTWRRAVAGATAISTVEPMADLAWFADGRLFVPYATRGDAAVERLSCLDADTGDSVFDVALEGIEAGRLYALDGADGRLYVTHSKGLDAYDAKSGRHVEHLSD